LQRLYRRKPKLQKRNKHESWVKRGGLGAFVAENSTASFFAPKVAKTVLQGEFCNVCTVENRNYKNATNMSLGSNGVDWVRSLRKIQLRVFFAPKVAKTVLQGEFCNVCTVENRNYKNATNMSLGSNGVDWVRSLRKIQLRVFLLQKSLKRSSRASFATFVPSKTETTKRNKHESWVKRGGLGAFVAENSTASFFAPKVAKTVLQGEFCNVCTVENRNYKNATNMSLGSNGVDWVRSLRKIQLRVFLLQKSLKRPPGRALRRLYRRKPKLRKRNKHESWVKRGGLGAFVAENSTASFFAPKVAKTVLQGELCNVCTVENRNYENATNMSLGSNGVDWVRSLRKIQLRVFLLQKSLKQSSRASFATFVPSKTETTKRNKHESWVKRGGLGAFVAENSTASFFAPKVAKTVLQGEFCNVCTVENRNYKNATNMSLGSNGVDWVRSLRKIQLRVFLLQKSLKRSSRASLQRLYRRKPKLQKRNKHESWVKRGGLGAFVAENSTASFFAPKVAKTVLQGELCNVCTVENRNYEKRNKHESWVKRGGLGAFVAENSTASFFAPKVAKTVLQGEFATFVPSKTETTKRNKHESWVKRGGLGAFVAENSTASFFAPKVAKTVLQGEFCNVCTVENRNYKNATNMSLGSNGVDWVRSLRKIQLRVFLLQKSLKRSSRASFCDVCTVENRNYENATNMSLGSNGVDWVRSLRKIQLRVFLLQKSLKQPPGRALRRLYRRKPKLRKRNKHESWVKRGGLGAFVAENSTASFFAPKVAKTVLQGEFCNVCTVENRNYKNATNMSLGSNGVDWVRSLRKIQLRVFLLQKSLKRSSRASFATFVPSKTETTKTQQT
jgi:hypothetical protein